MDKSEKTAPTLTPVATTLPPVTTLPQVTATPPTPAFVTSIPLQTTLVTPVRFADWGRKGAQDHWDSRQTAELLMQTPRTHATAPRPALGPPGLLAAEHEDEIVVIVAAAADDGSEFPVGDPLTPLVDLFLASYGAPPPQKVVTPFVDGDGSVSKK